MSAVQDQEAIKEEVRRRLGELREVCSDLERNLKMASVACNMIQAEQLRKRIAELTDTQTTMVNELVAMSCDQAARERFDQLSARLDDLKNEIKTSTDLEEIKRLQGDFEPAVERWVHQYQTIVASLMGAPPPPGPIKSQG